MERLKLDASVVPDLAQERLIRYLNCPGGKLKSILGKNKSQTKVLSKGASQSGWERRYLFGMYVVHQLKKLRVITSFEALKLFMTMITTEYSSTD